MSEMTTDPGRGRVVATVTEECTGCRACVEYCLVDCIEEGPADGPVAAAVHIREDECIGCRICAKVCEQLALNAIRLVPIAQLPPHPHPERGLAEVR